MDCQKWKCKFKYSTRRTELGFVIFIPRNAAHRSIEKMVLSEIVFGDGGATSKDCNGKILRQAYSKYTLVLVFVFGLLCMLLKSCPNKEITL